MLAGSERLVLALDLDDPDENLAVARACADAIGTFKIGPALVFGAGAGWLEALAAVGRPLFLDLKLHDIPETVARTTRAVKAMGAAYLTLHAGGGARMVRAAVDAAAGSALKLLGVTVLTSLSQDELEREVGIREPVADRVTAWARLARGAGAHGIVCSAHEIERVRAAAGRDALIVVPGIRSAGDPPDDQRRTLTAGEAAARGADLLVLGRTVLKAPDPAAAAVRLAGEVAGARVP